jgi:hypothetical protein
VHNKGQITKTVISVGINWRNFPAFCKEQIESYCDFFKTGSSNELTGKAF